MIATQEIFNIFKILKIRHLKMKNKNDVINDRNKRMGNK